MTTPFDCKSAARSGTRSWAAACVNYQYLTSICPVFVQYLSRTISCVWAVTPLVPPIYSRATADMHRCRLGCPAPPPRRPGPARVGWRRSAEPGLDPGLLLALPSGSPRRCAAAGPRRSRRGGRGGLGPRRSPPQTPGLSRRDRPADPAVPEPAAATAGSGRYRRAGGAHCFHRAL